MVPYEIYKQIENAEHYCNQATATKDGVEYMITMMREEGPVGFFRVHSFKDIGKGHVPCKMSDIPDIPAERWDVVDEY